MGALRQLGLLLWRNLLRKKRQPTLFALELVWPTAIFLVIALVRMVAPPERQETCQYQPRYMPSAGGVDFIQSFVCNVNNECRGESRTYEEASARMAEMLAAIGPLMSDPNTTKSLLMNLPKTTQLLTSLSETLNQPRIKELIHVDMRVGNLFRDEQYLENYLTNDTQAISPAVAEGLMEARVNLNEIYQLTGFIDLQGSVCDPEKLAKYLIFSQQVDIQSISNNLCAIDESLIPNITNVLRDELDVSKILRIGSKLMKLAEEYTVADGLIDLADLVEVIGTQDSVQNLTDAYVQLGRTSEWIGSLAEFARNLNGSLGEQILSFSNLLNNMDPLVKNLSGQSGMWEQVREGYNYIKVLTNWTAGGSMQLPDTTGILNEVALKEPLLLEQFMRLFNFSDEASQAMMRSRINTTRITQILMDIRQSKSLKSFCKNGSLSSVFVTTSPSDAAKLKEASKAFCQQLHQGNDTRPLFDRNLTDSLAGLTMMSSTLGDRLNWTEIIETGAKVIDQVKSISPQLEPILESVQNGQLQEVWDTGAKLLAGVHDIQNMSLTQGPIVTACSLLEGALRGQAMWPYIRPVLIAANITIGIVEHVLKDLPAFEMNLAQKLGNNSAFQNLLLGLKQLGGENSDKVLRFFTSPNTTQLMISNPEAVGRDICEGSALEEVLGAKAVKEDGWILTYLKAAICEGDLIIVVNKLIKEAGASKAEEQIRLLTGVLDGSIDLTSAMWEDRANLTQMVLNAIDLAYFIDANGVQVQVDWNKVVGQPGLANLGGEFPAWEVLMTNIEQNLLRQAFVQWGKLIENSYIWEYINEHVLNLYTSLRIYNTQVSSMNAYMSDEEDVGKLLMYMVEYGADLGQAFADIIRDPERRKLLFVATDPIGLFCIPLPVGDVMNLRPGVPIDDIQKAICKVDPTDIVQPLVDLIESSNAMFSRSYDKDFTWGSLFDVVMEFQSAITEMSSPSSPMEKMITTMSKVDTKSFTKAQNAMTIALNSLDVEESERMNTFYLGALEGLDKRWADADDKWWNTVKSKINVMNDMAKDMNKMMDSLEENKLVLSGYLSENTQLRQMLETVYTVGPDMMDAMMKTIIRPEKIMKMLATVDLSEKTLCNGISLNDIMDFKNPSKISKMEEMLCKMDLTEIQTELQNDPVAAVYSQKMQALMDSSVVTNEIIVDWKGFMSTMKTTMKNMEEMISAEPKIPGMDMEMMQTLLVQMANNVTTNTIQIYQLLGMMHDTIYNMTAESIPAEYDRAFNILQATLDLLNNEPMLNVSGRSLSMLDFVRIPMVERLMTLLADSPKAADIVLKSLSNSIMNPQRLDRMLAWLMDPTAVCSNTTSLDIVFPEIAASDVEKEKVQTAFCELASTFTAKDGEDLSVSFMFAVDNITKLSQKIEAALTGKSPRPDFAGVVQGLDSYLKMLMVLSENPPTLQNFWGEVINPEVWSSIFTDFTKQASQSLQTISIDDIAPAALRMMIELFMPLIPPMPSAEMLNDINEILEIVYRGLDEFAGRNLTLEDLTRNGPETSKVVDILPKFPTAVEVVLHTLFVNPTKIQTSPLLAGDWNGSCQKTVEEQYEIPSSLAIDFKHLHETLCSIDTDVISKELGSVIDMEAIAKVLTEKSNKDISGQDLLQNVLKLQELLSSMGLQEDALDLSWLDANMWLGMLTRLTSTFENRTVYDSLAEVETALTPLLDSLFTQTNATTALRPLIAKATDFMRVLDAELQNLVALNLTWLEVIIPRPLTSSLMYGVNEIPSIVEVLVNTALRNPEMLRKFLEGDPASLCQLPLQNQVVMLPYLEESYLYGMFSFCYTTNYTDIARELSGIVNFQKIQQVLLTKTEREGNMQELRDATEKLVATLTMINNEQPEPNVLFDNPLLWGNVTFAFMKGLDKTTLITNLPGSLQTMYPRLWEAVESVLSLLDVGMMTNRITEISSIIGTQLSPLTSMNISITEYLSDKPETSRLVRLLPNMPLLIEVFISTSIDSPEKMQVNDINAFCETARSIFSVQPANSERFFGTLQKLCSINYETVGNELGDLVNVKAISAVFMSNTTSNKANFTVFMDSQNKLTKIITELINRPPQPGPDIMALFNQTLWTAAWERIEKVAVAPRTLEESLLGAVSGVEAMLTQVTLDVGLHATLVQATRLMKIVNTDVGMLIGRNMSLQDLVIGRPETQRLVYTLPDVPVFLEGILATVIQKPENVASLVGGELKAICDIPTSSLSIPEGGRSRFLNVKQTLCNLNGEAIVQELEGLVRVREIQQILEQRAPAGAHVNFTSLIMETTRMVELWTELSTNGAPAFDTSFINEVAWKDAINRLLLFLDNPNALSSSLDDIMAVIPSLEGLLSNVTSSLNLNSLVNKADAMAGLFVDILEPLVAANLSEAMVKDLQPETQRLIRMIPYAPVLFEVLFNTVLTKPEQAQHIIESNLRALCDTSKDSVLVVPENVAAEFNKLTAEFCRFDPERLQDELGRQFNYGIFEQVLSSPMNGTANVTSFTAKAERLYRVIDRINNSPLGSTNVTSLGLKLLGPAIKTESWNSVLQTLTTRLSLPTSPDILTETYLSSINTLLANIMEEGLLDPWLVRMTSLMAYLNPKLEQLNRGNLTHNALFGDSKEFEKLLKILPHFFVLGEVYHLSTIFKPATTTPILSGDLKVFCSGDPEVLFEVPSHLNSTFREIHTTLCTMNYTALERELTGIISVETIENILSANVTGIRLNTTKLVGESTRFSANLQTFIEMMTTGFTVPIENYVEDFVKMFERIYLYITDKVPENTIETLFGQQATFLYRLTLAYQVTTELDPFLSKLDLVLDYILTQSDALLGRPLTVGTLLATSPESARLFNLSEKLPTLVEVTLQSLLNQSRPMTALLGGDLVTFCTSSLEEFVLKENQMKEFNEARVVICSSNYTKVQKELGEFVDIEMLWKIDDADMNMQTQNFWSLPDKITRVTEMFSTLNGQSMFQMDFSWLNETIWTKILENVVKSLEGNNNQMLSTGSLQEYLPLAEMLNGVLGNISPAIYKMSQIMERINREMRSLPGRNLTLNDLFSDHPEIQRLSLLLPHLPAITATLISTSNSGQQQMTSFIEELLMDPSNIERLCHNDTFKLFDVPAGFEQEIDYVWKYICTLNSTKLTEQLSDRFNIDEILADLDGSTEQSKGNLTVLLSQVNEFINTFAQQPPVFNVDTSWLDQGVWDNILQAVTSAYSEEALMQAVTDVSQQIGPILSSLMGGFNMTTEMESWYRTALELSGAINKLGLAVRGPLSALSGLPETTKVLNMLNSLPDALRQLIVDTVEDQEKVNQLINEAMSNPSTLCQPGNPLLPELAVDICNVNWTMVQRELGIAMPQIGKFNLTEAIAKYTENSATTQRLLTEIIGGQIDPSWTWLQEGVWKNMSSSLTKLLAGTGNTEVTPDNFKQLVQSLQSLEPLLKSAGLLGQVHASNAVIDILMKKLELMARMNKTTVHITELFPKSPGIRELLILLEMNPGTLEILYSNIQRPQFIPAFLSGDFAEIWERVTASDAGFKEFFLIPEQVKINLRSLREDMKRIEPKKLQEEIYREFSIRLIEAAGMNNNSVNWEAMYGRIVNVTDLITLLIERNISIELLGPWADEAFWMETLSKLASYNQFTSYSSYADIFELLKMSNDSTVESMHSILAAMAQTAEQQLVTWAQQNQMSLGTILQETPQLYQAVKATLDNLPEVTGWLMYASVNNAAKLVEMLMSPNLIDYLCASSVTEISQIYRIPPSINMNEFYAAICQVNTSSLNKEVLDGFGLSKLIEQIDGIVSGTIRESANLTAFIASLRQNGDAIEMLISNPPSFLPVEVNTEKLQSIFDEFLRKLLNPTEVNPDQFLSLFWQMASYVYGPEAGELLTSYVELGRIYADFGNNVLAAIQKDVGTLKLKDLFNNETRLRELLRPAITSEDTITKLINLNVRTEMLGLLMNLEPEAIKQILCDRAQLQRYFEVPREMDLSQIISATCGTNRDLIAMDLQKSLTISKLLTQLSKRLNSTDLDWAELTRGYETLIKQTLRIFNISNADTIALDIWSIANITMASNSSMWSTLSGIDEGITTGLATLMSNENLALLYNGTAFWKEEMKTLSVIQTFMDVINNKIQTMRGSGIRISSLLTNATYTRNYLQQTFNILPEVIEVLMASEIDLAAVSRLASGADSSNPFCTDLVVFPQPGEVKADIDAVKQFLCSADGDAMIEELIPEFDIRALRDAFIGTTDLSSFTWARYTESISRTQREVTWFMTNATLPTLPEFIGYRGNWTAWVANMNRVFQTPVMNDSDTLNWVGAWANQQSMAVLSGNPEVDAYITTIANYINDMALALDGRLSSLPVDVTLKDILKNEPLLSAYLSDTFGIAPTIINGIMSQNIDLSKFLQSINWMNSTDILPLLCGGAITGVRNDTYFCTADYADIGVEVQKLFRLDILMEMLAENSDKVDLKPVDWTLYLQNLQKLQTHLGTTFSSPINVTHFFAYPGDLSSWIDKLSAGLEPAMDDAGLMDLVNRLTIASNSVRDMILANINDAYPALLPALDTVSSILIDRTSSLRDGRVTIDDILGGAPNLRSQLTSLNRLTDRDLSALLQASVKLELIADITDPAQIKEALCSRPLDEVMTLPMGDYPSIEDLQKRLCALDLEVLSQELSQILSIDRIINEISKLQDSWMVNITSIPTGYNTTAGTKSIQLADMLQRMIENPPAIAPELQRLFNFTKLAPLLDRIMDIQMEAQVLQAARSIEESIAQLPGFQEAAFTINELISWINTQLAFMKDSGRNLELIMDSSADFTRVYNQLLQGLPGLQNHILHNLRDRPQLREAAMMVSIQDLVCNQTAFDAATREAGFWLRNSSFVIEPLCGKPASQWFDTLATVLKNAGIDTSAMVEIVQIFDRLRLSQSMGNLTDAVGAPQSIFNISSLEGNVKKMIDLITSIEQYTGENADLIKDGGLKEMKTLLQSLDLKTANHTLAYIMYQLDVLVSETASTSVGFDFLSMSRYASVFMDFVHTLIQKAEVKNSRISLASIIPDKKKAKDFLGELLPPDSVDMLFKGATISPENLLKLLNTTSWNMKKCYEITEPAGSDMEDPLLNELCKIADINPAALQRFANLISLNATIQELRKAAELKTVSWEDLSEGVFRMLKNLRILTNETLGEEYSAISDWVEIFTQGNENITTATCNATPIQETLVWAEAMVDFTKGIPEIESILCNMETLNLTLLSNQIGDSQVMKGIIKITLRKHVGCQSPYARFMEFYSDAESSFGKIPASLERTLTCLAATANKTIPSLMELQEIATLWNEIQDLIVKFPGFPDFVSGLTPEIKSFLNLFLAVLIDQQPVWTDVSDIFVNRTGIIEYFEHVANVTPKVADAFMTATLDLTKLPTSSSKELGVILCDPDRLDKLLILPDTLDVNTTTLSKELCTLLSNETANQIRQGLDLGKILLKLSETPPEYSMNTTFLSGSLSSLEQIMSSISNLTGVIRIFDDVPTLGALREILPDLQVFLADNGPEQIYKDIMKFVGLFGKIGDDPTAKLVLGEIELIGKKVLDAGIFARLMNYIDVNVKDILSYEELVIKQLGDLGVEQDVAKTLLDSSFSFVELLDMESKDIPGLICDPNRLGKLITLPAHTNVTIIEMSNGLCGLDKAKAIPVSETLIQNLEVGNLIKDFVNLSPSNFLKGSNMTKDDINEMLQQFEPVKEKFKTIANSMGNMSSLVAVTVNVSSPATSASSASMTTLSQLLCGTSSALKIEDEFNINSGAKKGVSTEITWTEEEEAEMAELKTEFCVDMYKQIVSSGVTGRVAWSYVKPLIVGTILYSPDTPATKALMDEALWITETIADLSELTGAWIDGIGSLNEFGYQSENQKILKEALSNPFISSAMYEMVGVRGDQLLDQLSSLEAFASGDLEALTVLAKLLHNITDCVHIKVEPVTTEEELVLQSQELSKGNSLLAGVVFMNMDEAHAYSDNSRQRRDVSSNNGSKTWAGEWLPKHLKYKIRMDTDSVPSTVDIKDRVTDFLKKDLSYQKNRIYRAGPEDNFAQDLRYLRGFLPMEDMIEKAFIKLQAGKSTVYPKVEVQQMPYPCYEKDDFSHYVSRYYFPIAMTLAWLFAMGTAITLFMKDKESGMNQMMKVMGLRGGFTWLSWFIPTMIMALVVSGIITFFLKVGQLMRYSNTGIIYLSLVNFSFSACMLSYLISALFQRATMASLTGLLIYLISYLPYIIVVGVHVEMVFWHRIVVSLSSTCAFSYAGQIMSDLEQRGVGIHWFNTDYGYDGFNFAWAQYMMLIDSAIYGFLAWYISHINPGKFGLAQPWYFPFSPSYWGCRKPKYYGQGQPDSSRRAKPMKYIDHTQDTKAEKYQEDEASDDTYQNIPHFQQVKPDANTSLMYITPSRLTLERRRPERLKRTSRESVGPCGPGEPDPLDLPIGVSLHHLTKKYKSGQRPAVNDLSVNFYQGQVTAFLGHNGAGKSSTIHMLTGIFPPTSGTAYVSGYDILADNSQLKTTLGFCPQHDVLFEHMTVLEHMEFFCKVKGKLNRKESNDEVKIMINKTGLQKEVSTPVSQLSGGQRRRLSVALAFIGGSKVVILDEPTSGVDPSARRLIWDLIIDHREGRTIVLSTHHLDEAEVIGDRIVVIHQGKLVCTGSPLFLKSEYGSGYNLTMAKLQPRLKSPSSQADVSGALIEECKSQDVLEFIQRYINGARLVEEIGTEMTFMLPTTRGQAQSFKDLFTDLEMAKEKLHIDKYGVSDTTLEEVFLKLTRMAERGEPLDGERLREWTLMRGELGSPFDRRSNAGTSTQSKATKTNDIAEVAINVGTPGPMRGQAQHKGAKLKLRQFRGLLTKRLNHNRRDLRSYLSQIVMPCIFILFAMGCTLIKPQNKDMPSVLITTELYPHQSMFFRNEPGSNNTFNEMIIQTMFHEPGIGTTCMDGSTHKSTICKGRKPSYHDPAETTSSLPRCECRDGRQECSDNVKEYAETIPYLKTASKSTVYNLTSDPLETPDYLLYTHGLISSQNRYGGWTFDTEDSNPKATIWFNNKGHHALPAFYNALNNMVLRANMEAKGDNMSAGDYGVSVYNHPLNASKEQLSEFSLLQGIADTGIALTILCAFCFVPAGYIIYLIHERVHQEKQLQMICGVSVVQYWCSAFIWDMFTYLITVALAACITLAFNLPIYTSRLNLPAFLVLLILFGYATIPLSYVMVRIFNDVSIGYMTVFILNLFIGINATSATFLLSLFRSNPSIAHAHDILQKVLLVLPQYALGDGMVQLSYNQFMTEIFERFGLDNYVNPFSFELVGWNMVAMAIVGTVLFILTILTDSRGCVSTSSIAKRQNADYKEDSDVSLERQRVVTGEARNDLITLHNLTKIYRRGLKKVLAVENLCLGVPKGECFGLLGINGAGKTTTFKMITGNLLPTGGAAILNGKTISEDMSKMDQNVGYCPQQDALDPMLTGSEMLYCLARLKGIPEEDIQEVTDSALQRFGLGKEANKLVKTYSGGNKRKLSTALALLGEPDLILLDEPTTGMDPATRRLVWNNITGVIKDNRSVILTSHSMAECDALCTRLAIMVNGHFTCLGSGQHLKNKFGGSYTVKLRVSGHSINLSAVVDFMTSTFPGCYLKNRHHHMLEFDLPSHVSSLSDLFGVLEIEKHNLHVEDYSISQTTLDQLFVDFADRQTDGTTPEPDYDLSPEEGASSKYAYTNRSYDTLSDGPHVHPTTKFNANIKDNTGSLRLRSSLHALPKTAGEEEGAVPVKDKDVPATITILTPEGRVVGAPLRSGAPLRHVPPITSAEALDSVREGQNQHHYERPQERAMEQGALDRVAPASEMEYVPTESLSIRL